MASSNTVRALNGGAEPGRPPRCRGPAQNGGRFADDRAKPQLRLEKEIHEAGWPTMRRGSRAGDDPTRRDIDGASVPATTQRYAARRKGRPSSSRPIQQVYEPGSVMRYSPRRRTRGRVVR